MSVSTRMTRQEWAQQWLGENDGLCRICNAAAPTTDPLECASGCDVEAAYQRGGYRPLTTTTSTTTTMVPNRHDERRLVLVCAKDVEPEDVQWLWEGWLPFGKMVVVDGAPGVGKTALIIDLIARASRGDPMPGSDR